MQTIIIGAGQAGLSVGYHLARRRLPFLILDRHARIGDTWRQSWDSLRLFSPARYDGIAGMPFPGRGDASPTKDAMADYLESYAAHFALPVRTGVTVDHVARDGDRYILTAGRTQYEAEQVVVATGAFQRARVPEFARDLDPRITQLHSSRYRNPSQLRAGGVLVVGAGNSGAEIAKEVASRQYQTWLSGQESGELPFRVESWLGRQILSRLIFRLVFHRLLTIDTPMGRKARQNLHSGATPLIRTRSADLAAAGVVRVPRVAGIRDGRPLLDDGRVLDVSNVIWCTGYSPDFSWLDVPVLDAQGNPIHTRGVTSVPGFYFVGLPFLYAMSSSMIHGVSRDAAYLAEAINARAEHLRFHGTSAARPLTRIAS